MQLEELWQRPAAALVDSRDHFSAFNPYPVPNCMRVIPGLPGLLPPMSAKQKKRTPYLPRPASSAPVRAQTPLNLRVHPLHPGGLYVSGDAR